MDLKLVEELHKCVFPIIGDPDGRRFMMGSGCFYRRNGKVFAVSAAHALEDLLKDPKAVAIPERPDPVLAVNLWTFGTGRLGLTKTSEYDVGIYCLDDPAVVQRIEANWTVLTDHDVDDEPGPDEHVVFGWPHANVRLDDPAGCIRGRVVGYKVNRIQPPELPYDATPLNGADVFLEWPKEKDVPKLPGISGSPIWALKKQARGLHYSKPVPRLVAVEHGVQHRGYIRGTHWKVVELACDRMNETET